MNENRFIKITFRNGKSIVWDAEKDEWDDYSMRSADKIFIIWRKGNKTSLSESTKIFRPLSAKPALGVLP